jgi:hypothetical protein
MSEKIEAQRYSLRFNSGNPRMFAVDDAGEWVKWEDYRALLAELARVRQERDGYEKALSYDHGELLKVEASLAAVRAALGEIEQEIRDEDWHQHTTSPLSVEAVVNQWADRLAALRLGKDGE